MADKSQKTEKPTPKRRREARRDGDIPRTADLSAWLTVFVFVVLGPAAINALKELFQVLMGIVRSTAAHPDAGAVPEALRSGLIGALSVVAPILLTTVLVGSLGFIVQGGIRVSSKRFKPQWKRLNPAKGLKNLFSQHAAWTLVKTLLKFAIFGWVAYTVLRGAAERITGTGAWSLSAVLNVAESASLDLMRYVAVLGLVIAAADWAMERRRNEKSLKMSKEDVKRENKQSEGDPHLKGAIRSRQRDMGRRRMMASVGKATVVLVNPTHVAVALVYEQGQGAPKVVAKGAGYIAQRIREEAEAYAVPMIRDPIVARALFRACEIGEFIPPELYDAIAQVLAFIMRLSGLGRAEGTHDTPIRHPAAIGESLPEDLNDEALGIAAASA